MMPLLIAGRRPKRRRAPGRRSCWRAVGLGGPDDASAVGALGRRAAAGGGGARAGDRPGASLLADEPSGNLDRAQRRAAARPLREPGARARDGAGRGDPQPAAGRAGRPGAVAGGGPAGAGDRARRRCPDALRPVPGARRGRAPDADRGRAGDARCTSASSARRSGGGELRRRCRRRRSASFLAAMGKQRRAAARRRQPRGACPGCGATLQDFRESGPTRLRRLLRAPSSAPLRDLLRRLHGSTTHVGERYAAPARRRPALPTSCGARPRRAAGAAPARGRGGALRAGRRAAGPAPTRVAGMIDLTPAPRRRRRLARRERARSSHLVLSTRIRLARNLAGRVVHRPERERERERMLRAGARRRRAETPTAPAGGALPARPAGAGRPAAAARAAPGEQGAGGSRRRRRGCAPGPACCSRDGSA